jgi:hypothetical protein
MRFSFTIPSLQFNVASNVHPGNRLSILINHFTIKILRLCVLLCALYFFI